jgi:hypothetical protein
MPNQAAPRLHGAGLCEVRGWAEKAFDKALELDPTRAALAQASPNWPGQMAEAEKLRETHPENGKHFNTHECWEIRADRLRRYEDWTAGLSGLDAKR